MGMAGVPFPWHVTLIEPGSAFNLDYAVNSLAMPMIGGTTTWLGPPGRGSAARAPRSRSPP